MEGADGDRARLPKPDMPPHEPIAVDRIAGSRSDREAEWRSLVADLERRLRDRTAALHRANTRLAAEIERGAAMQTAAQQSHRLEAIGQLTSGIAHDFNNILGAVLGGFAIIENRTDDPRIRQVVGMGQRAAERGAALVRQLLAFTRQQDVLPQPTDLVATIGEVSDLLAHGVRRDMTIAIDCAPDVWRALVDATQLQSALLNLANNASDAMHGVGCLQLRIGNCPAGTPDHPAELDGRDAVRIVVADDGPGIDSKTLQRVTEPFFTTKARGKGTGLGLAMVQRFIEQAHGALRIESHVGRGTTFTLYLPRAFLPTDTGIPNEASAQVEASPSSHDPPPERAVETVLLVDDDRDLTEILSHALSDSGFEVLTAQDAATAQAILRARSVDLIVADRDMPDMSGPALATPLRGSGLDVPRLFMTADSSQDVPEGEMVLHKPFTPAGLHYAIRRILRASQHRLCDDERIDRLASRLKSSGTRTLLDRWRAIRDGPTIPRFDRFAIDPCADPHRIFVATIDLCKSPIAFTFTRIGPTQTPDAPPDGSHDRLAISGNDALAICDAAYRRCALTGRPSYEYARIDLGDGYLETFERLLLPFSADGTLVDHIVGAVVIDRTPLPPIGPGASDGDHR
jgi:signal transduction histidine kinase/FixJ family two-component response regulator